MSDDLEIRSGAAIAVDTASLRAAAAGFDRAAAVCVAAADDARRVAGLVAGVPGAGWQATLGETLARGVVDGADGLALLGRGLRGAADAYEHAEVVAAQSAGSTAGGAADAALIGWGDPSPWLHRWYDDGSRALRPPMAIVRTLFPTLITAEAALLGTVLGLDRGRVRAGARLSGDPVPVTVTALSRSETAAPRSLADVAARVPSIGAERVRVERYTMADGSRRFAVYAAGTQQLNPVERSDPFDMVSNIELYDGTRSASYDAVVEALRDSGAQPGDVVHAAGYSQAGMIVGRMAQEGEFAVSSVFTFGSPTTVDVGPDVLRVDVRHLDDPVGLLAAGGLPDAAGSADSVTVERRVGGLTAPLGTHAIDAYAETAALADASTDPRMGVVSEALAELREAVRVEATVYGARRGAGVSAKIASSAGGG